MRLTSCRVAATYLAILIFLSSTTALRARQNEQAGSYILPPEPIRAALGQDKNFAVLDNLSPDGDHFLIPSTTELSSLKLMSQKIYRLAMLKVTPATNRELDHSTFGIYALKIYSLKSGASQSVRLPAGTFASDMVWSPDGKKLAFLAHLPEGSQVWTADAATAVAGPVSNAYVMATLATGGGARRGRGVPSRMLQWLPDGSIATLLVPSGRGPEPAENPVPTSPIIRLSLDRAAPTSTLPFLLRTRHDEDLFHYYTTAQLAILAPGQPPRNVGAPAMYLGISLSPDGKYLLADKLVDPLSYLVGYTSFGHNNEVMDLTGRTLATVAKTPLRVGSRGDAAGGDQPREIVWRPDGKGLSFLSLAKAEKPAAESESESAPRTDRVMLLAPPFDMAQAQVVVSSTKRFSAVSYSSNGGLLFATLADQGGAGSQRRQEVVAYDLGAGRGQPYVLAAAFDPEDIVNLPGTIMTRADGNGISSALLSSNREAAYLSGAGYKADHKPRPFIDRVVVRSGAHERVFEGSSEMFEQPLTPLDDDMARIVISRESKSVFPDSYLWTPQGLGANLTHNRDPYPEITACRRIDFNFKRNDGVTVYGRISLPVGYRDGTRVPAVFWDYPREYASGEEYERDAVRARNENAFTPLSFLRWSDLWLTRGYALVYTDIPIVGKGDTYNDFYLTHLLDSVYGAIRKLDQMGTIDVDRLGHGGHSYGAFTTGNLLAHSPLFKAGIAGDGAYNRSLTPMAFQNERRFLWTAQTTYLEISPFFYADQINAPLLMYHGGEDDNSGTFVIQSERMMQALTGLGKKAALYIYPFEAHSPRCRETYLDIWARWIDWFDTYVKNPGSAAK